MPAMTPDVSNEAIAVRYLRITAEQAGQRIDNFLITSLKGVPRSRIYRLLRRGEVRVNRRRARPDYRLQADDELRLPPVRQAERPAAALVPRSLQQSLVAAIRYRDDALFVVDKPAGLAVHGGSGVSFGLIEALRQALPEEHGLELVHRLDRETSGCLLIARKRSALRQLHAALRSGGVEKHYLALVAGHWPGGLDEVRAPLAKNQLQSGERMVKVDEQGKFAHTRFAVLQRLEGCTLVDAEPVTGRTHQIRVHARQAGHPIAGDAKYGDDAFSRRMREHGLKRLFLHASRLGFISPATGKRVDVEVPLPEDLTDVLRQCGAEGAGC